jgi:NADH-quinone oxidoreductase subunit M
LGAEYRGPHEEALTPSTLRENLIAGVLFVFAILFGVFPYNIPLFNSPSILAYMEPTIKRQVEDLANWTKEVKQPEIVVTTSSATNPETVQVTSSR